MHKSTKAALASMTGAGLLLGGAGSLAYWSDTEGLPGTTITPGSLDLVGGGCGDGWTVGGAPVDLDTYLVVPGETLTRTCTFTLDLAGDALSANLALSTPGAVSGTLAGELVYDATYSVAGTAPAPLTGGTVAALTGADDGEQVSVAFSVTLPRDGNNVVPGVDNDSNNGPGFGNGSLSATLDALSVSLTQSVV